LAAVAAVFLSVVGCTLPIQQGGKSGNDKNVAIASPSPSPSPSPTSTQQLAASAPAFHIGEVGVGYTPVALTATGGVPPYHWNVSGGTLPPGLTIGSDGSLSGTPAAAGAFPFSIEVSDSADGTAPIKGTINIASALNVSLLPGCAKYCNVELGCVNACGAFGQQAGGVGPFTYNLSQGTLPSGTALSALSLKGTFTGQTGYLQFTVQVTDSLGGTDTVSPTFWMYPHVVLTGGTIPSNPQFPCWWTGYDPVNAPGCQAKFPYKGGTPGAGTPTVSASWVSYTKNCTPPPTSVPPPCPTPPMPTITVGGGYVIVTVPTGGREWGSGYQGTLNLLLSNQDACAGGPTRCSASAQVNITQQPS
jgi:putative Ig domain-containing protein